MRLWRQGQGHTHARHGAAATASIRTLLVAGVTLALVLAAVIVLIVWSRVAIRIGALSAIIGVLASLLLGKLLRRRRGAVGQAAAPDDDRQFRLIAEHAFDMLLRIDPETQQRKYISPGCRRLYGYEPEEALALSTADIIHPEDYPGVCEAMRRLETTPDQPPIQYRARRKDGVYIWVEASLARATDPATGASEIVSVVRDVSERIRYEAALHQAKEEADSANRSKSQFLATMSHELRTPLNAIIGFAEIMQNQVMGPIGNDHYRSYIGDIHLSGTHLLQLINDILDLTKAEAGMLELNEDLIDVGSAIGAVARVTKAPVEKAGLTLELNLPRDLPSLRADERKTRQVFFNLIGNAIKFTPAGGRIRVRGAFDPQGGLRIVVADTGIGIAPEDLERVLAPFVQVDSSFARQHHGTGLGLPAVKAIMELHGGRIELSSRLGEGTDAVVVFPPERAVPRASAQQPQSPARSAA